MHIKRINHHKSDILYLIELKFFIAYLSLKPHILFYSNGLAICHGFARYYEYLTSAVFAVVT